MPKVSALTSAVTINDTDILYVVSGTSSLKATISALAVNLVTGGSKAASFSSLNIVGSGGTSTITSGSNTVQLFPTTVTTLNVGGAATTINLGVNGGTTNVLGNFSVAGTFTINNNQSFGANITVSGDAAINGGDLTSTSATFNILESNVATINLGAVATTIRLGYTGTAGSTTNIATGAVASPNTKIVNIGTGASAGGATTITIGAAGSGSTTTILGNLVATLTGNASTATQVIATVTGTNSIELVRGNMADNDNFRILVGGTATNTGFAEIATADDGTEPIYVRQYTGNFATLTREVVLLSGTGTTSFPVSVTSPTFIGSLNGNANTATTATNVSGGTASVTTLTASGTASINGNTTLGTGVGNSHTFNGSVSITNNTTLGTGVGNSHTFNGSVSITNNVTVTGNVNTIGGIGVGAGKVSNITSVTANNDAANKAYVDSRTPVNPISFGNFNGSARTLYHSGYMQGGNLYSIGESQYIHGNIGTNASTDTSGYPWKAGVPMGIKFTQMVSNYASTMAVDINGHVWAMGQKFHGEFGDGVATGIIKPTKTYPFAGSPTLPVVYLHSNGSYNDLRTSGIVLSDGRTYVAGNNSQGQLGINSTVQQNTWVQTTLPSGATSGKEFYFAGYTSYAISSDATGNRLYAAGDDTTGQLGNSAAIGPDSLVWVPVVTRADVALQNVKKFRASGNQTTSIFAAALLANGDLYTWGVNTDGQIGDGTTTNNGRAFLALTGVIDFELAGEGGTTTVMAYTATNLYTWGTHTATEFGGAFGVTTNVTTPTIRVFPSGITGTTVEKLWGTCGCYAAVNVFWLKGTNKTLWAIGDNSASADGHAGVGTITDVTSWTEVVIPEEVVDISLRSGPSSGTFPLTLFAGISGSLYGAGHTNMLSTSKTSTGTPIRFPTFKDDI